jgi:type IV fimbrial biogenesis protein FimT
MSRFTKSRGFTLIELMVVVSIAAIALAVALPSFNEAITRNRLAGQTNELIAAISLARTVSIQLNTGGGFCAANTTVDDCGGSWDNGWISWSDVNRNGTLNDGEIRSTGPVNANDELIGTLAIRFDGRGRRILPALAAGNAVMTLEPRTCVSGKEHVRTLTVTASGSVNLAKGNC